MASTPTTNLLLEKQGKFENTETWDELLNAAIDQIDYAISGTAAIATTGGTTTLDNANYTVDDAKAAVLYITGTLASNSEIVVPSTSRVYVVRNATSGAYSVTVKTAAGSGVVVTQGTVQLVAVDATADDTYAVSVAGALGVASDSGTASVDLETQSLTLTGGTGIDTSATGQAATIAIDSTVATLTGSQTLTNKSIDLASNTLTGTQAQFDTACSDGNFVYTDDIGVSVQAYSANLDSWSGVAPSAYTTVASLAATTTGNGASLVGIEDSGGLITATTVEGALAENRTAIDAIESDYLTSASIGVSVQAYDAVLADLAGITPAQGDIYYHNGANLVALSPGTAGYVLQTGGPAANPSWEAAGAGSGDVSSSATITDNALVRGDGGAKGVQETGIIIADTTNDMSGVGSITPVAGSALRTATTSTNTLLLQAYDVDGTAYTTFATLTAGNTPTFDLSAATTIGTDTIVSLTGTQTLTNKTLTSPTINTPSLSANSVDAITEISASLKSGADATLITGTSGTSGTLAQWNSDGDIVVGPYATAPTVQTFTSSGTWTKPTGCRFIKVTVKGGGGGGRSSTSTGAGNSSAGGGGGEGGTAIEWIDATSLTSETVTIGAGGAASTAGGTSSFGAHCSATGGGIGESPASSSVWTVRTGGEGGVGSGGTINIGGVAGSVGQGFGADDRAVGGKGGGPGGGVGANYTSSQTDGSAASGYGAGGGGAATAASGSAATGGAGSSGICIVEEFY